LKPLAACLVLAGLATQAFAQSSTPQRVEITGSSIKRIQTEGALPVQTISRTELDRQGILSAEQLISTLNLNGNGLDNLAGNADVVSGQARGNNGATSANLRGQGASATLVLLNGRRVAAHGLNGGVVDLNQIPFAAVDRVEVLKDGASSIYGTDAIGGVINFILRKDFKGLSASATADVTEAGGGNILRGSVVGGFGDLDKDRFNLLATLSVSDHKKLAGSERSFVNTFQADRGLSPDTRGAPFATLFTLSGAGSLKTVLTRPGQTNTATGPLYNGVTLNGINTLDLPGQAGCASQPNMGAYDEKVWAAGAGAQFGCAWDNGKAAVIQQPVTNTNAVLRGTWRLGEHQLVAEAVLGRSESAKEFSHNQISSSGGAATLTLPNGSVVPSPFRNLAYPSTGAGYNRVFNALVATFPELEANRGLPMAFRWRCIACGPREIETQSDTSRYLLAMDGPLPFLAGWDYRLGASSAKSTSKSVLGSGYHYWQGFANLLNTGVLNPFLLAGEAQTPQAMAALDAISARGVSLYGGEFSMTQADATVSGPLFKLPGGDVLAAVGVDMRTEKYKFNGNQSVNTNDVATWVFNAPFDNVNALAGAKRDIKAAFAEVILPVTKQLELNLSARQDDYTGFGSTSNPKVSARFTPTDSLLMRGSYSTGFRVPTFNQLYNGVTESPYSGVGIVDPERCPALVVNTTPGNACNAITFNTLFGGKADLGPEEAKMATLGLVWQVSPQVSASVDWWSIERNGTIQSLGITGATGLLANYALFKDRFIRNTAGNIVQIDQRWINAGETVTKGLEVGVRGTSPFMKGRLSGGLDVAYLLEKKSRLVPSAPFGVSEVGVFTRSGDLGIRWKHTAFVSYTEGAWNGTLTQLYRGGYAGYVPPGVNSSYTPSAWEPLVKPYATYGASVSYSGLKGMTLLFGIKNLFDKDPPYAHAQDTNTGSGSSWEPRVADPRGRSYQFGLEYKFF
jgi:iron complex outermembrane receptor protein